MTASISKLNMQEEIVGLKFALVNAKKVQPAIFPVLYHGTAEESPEIFTENSGLPARGKDVDLIRHVEPPVARDETSAFRGTVPYPQSPALDAGACHWAGAGGWVYEIKNYLGYDINQVLEGRVPNGIGGFRNPHTTGEQEVAIPARVPNAFVARIGYVKSRRRGYSVDWNNI